MVNILSDWETGAVLVEAGVFEMPFQAGLAAAANLAETPIGLIGPGPAQIGLQSVQIHPGSAGLLANAANYVTVVVNRRPNGGAPQVIAQATTQPVANGGTGNWTAWTPVNLPLVNSTLLPGDSITISITTAGTGVAVPPFYLAGFTTMR